MITVGKLISILEEYPKDVEAKLQNGTPIRTIMNEATDLKQFVIISNHIPDRVCPFCGQFVFRTTKEDITKTPIYYCPCCNQEYTEKECEKVR